MKEDGRSAFPVPGERSEDGMTLRDYFAAKAISNVLTWSSYDLCAEAAYKIADAMLEARK
jgi:hypothetical protein